MKIGFIGLGKLGLPVALAMNLSGRDVMGFDLNNKLDNFIGEKDQDLSTV